MTSAFEYQLDILKIELDQINSAIRQMDEITKTIKERAIFTWAASLGIVLATKNLNPFIGLTAMIPIAFWIVDTEYRYVQSRFIYRNDKISNFLNGETFKQSFDEQKLINFDILDVMGKRDNDDPNLKRRKKIFKIFFYGDVCYLYICLITISILAHLIFFIYIS